MYALAVAPLPVWGWVAVTRLHVSLFAFLGMMTDSSVAGGLEAAFAFVVIAGPSLVFAGVGKTIGGTDRL
jgi:hypothetical protein